MNYLLCLFMTVLLYGIVLGRPQNQGNIGFFPTTAQLQQQQQQQQQRPFRPDQNPLFAAPSVTAPSTPSPQYLACLAACPSTMEYNPVCGDDEQSYHNMGRLQCAQRCGRNVGAVRAGTCLPM